jgi:hypothetical protein
VGAFPYVCVVFLSVCVFFFVCAFCMYVTICVWQLTVSPAIGEAWSRVLSDDSKVNWVIAGYEQDKTNELVVSLSTYVYVYIDMNTYRWIGSLRSTGSSPGMSRTRLTSSW